MHCKTRHAYNRVGRPTSELRTLFIYIFIVCLKNFL